MDMTGGKNLGIGLLLIVLLPTAAWGEWRVEKASKEVLLRGYTRSITKALMSAEVSGRVERVNYEVGDPIGGRPFAEIDTTFVDFDIESTRVSLARMETRMRQSQSRIDYLTKELDRKESLFQKGRTTEVVRDAASQELDQALLEKEMVAEERRSLAIALEQLLEKKARHAVRAHAGWIVTEKHVEVGEIVQPGTPLGVVQDFRQLVVPFSVSNEELRGIRQRGETFAARLEGLPAEVSIYYVNPEFNEKTRKIDMQLLVHDTPGERRGGLLLTLPVTVESPGMKIPADAVSNRYENPRVYREQDGIPVSIRILDSTADHLIIADDERLPVGTLLTTPKGQKP